MKKCNKCFIEKPLEGFTPNKNKPDGRMYTCKVCQAAIAREKRKTPGYMSKEQKEKARKRSALWRLENKERIPLQKKSWAQRNKQRWVASKARYRAQKLQAQPKWLSEDQVKEIESFYWLRDDIRAITGEDYHVDHIVPLKGKNVCGLHVPWNLQVLPSDVNLSKGNRI